MSLSARTSTKRARRGVPLEMFSSTKASSPEHFHPVNGKYFFYSCVSLEYSNFLKSKQNVWFSDYFFQHVSEIQNF